MRSLNGKKKNERKVKLGWGKLQKKNILGKSFPNEDRKLLVYGVFVSEEGKSVGGKKSKELFG